MRRSKGRLSRREQRRSTMRGSKRKRRSRKQVVVNEMKTNSRIVGRRQ